MLCSMASQASSGWRRFFRQKQWSKEQEEVSETSSGGKNAPDRESDVRIPGGKVSLLQDYCSSVHNPGS